MYEKLEAIHVARLCPEVFFACYDDFLSEVYADSVVVETVQNNAHCKIPGLT
jgi:hypothetical protein